MELMFTLGARRRGEVSVEAARRQRLVFVLDIGASGGERLILGLDIGSPGW